MEVAVIVIVVFVVILLLGIALASFLNKLHLCKCCAGRACDSWCDGDGDSLGDNSDDDSEDVMDDGDQSDGSDADDGNTNGIVTRDPVTVVEIDDEEEETEQEVNNYTTATDTNSKIIGEAFVVNKLEESLL